MDARTPMRRARFRRAPDRPTQAAMEAFMNRRDLLKAVGLATALGALPLSDRAAAAGKAKIGVIGSGKVGSALGGVWAKAGHEVMFSSRTLDDDKKLAAEVGANARAGTPNEAAKFGEVLLFAVPYGALP